MKEIDWHKLYVDELDAECCHGYYDGCRQDSPEPSSNRHPAYVHGFRNGRDDARITPRNETAAERRKAWAMIVATCSPGQ
jgi:hypothetical protein